MRPRATAPLVLALCFASGCAPAGVPARELEANAAAPAATPAVTTASGSSAPSGPLPRRATRLPDSACPLAETELLVPFYEGILVRDPPRLRETGGETFELAYPGPLSVPMVAWRCGRSEWTVIAAQDVTRTRASLHLAAAGDRFDVELRCLAPCELFTVRTTGDWHELARALRANLGLPAPKAPPLASRFSAFEFFVRKWVADDGQALRVDWEPAALLERVRKAPRGTMAFVYGLDPAGVDLAGEYLWSDGALAEARALTAVNPGVAQLSWLNLRTYKHRIPRLGLGAEPPAAVADSAKLYDGGPKRIRQYAFEATEMCLGAPAWQESRLVQLERLLDAGYRVIALDEFPTSPEWGARGCTARGHLHRAGDFDDEWRVALELVRRIVERAHARGALVTSEEPSAALLPWTSGYMDGSFNEPADMYEHWGKSSGVRRVPLFSELFGARVTPYTRPGTVRSAPEGWLVQRKVSR